MVRELIRRRFKVNLSEVSVPRLLRKLDQNPQPPQRKAYKQEEYLVLKWMAEDFKNIQKLVKIEDAEIFFGDESTVRSDYHSGTTWAPKGKPQLLKQLAPGTE